MTQAIYKFGKGINTGMFDDRIVGGKGAKLAEMGSLGLPVPAGVTITTQVCNNFLASTNDTSFISDIVDGVLNEYETIAEDIGYMPLVSVRSGARVSMPGMMDTILNVGISTDNFEEWADRIGADAAYDCYRRLIEMYGSIVLGIPVEVYAECENGVTGMLDIYSGLTGEHFPQALEEQLAGAIEAVFNSWNSERAVAYRSIHGYDDDWGTAVTVQQMVFGNKNNKSATGVVFTRDFNTGLDHIVGDWLPNAQGEDVVSGTHDTNPILELEKFDYDSAMRLLQYGFDLEEHYKDMQDIEFTIEDGELYILQTRNGKRSALAAFRIAYDFYLSEEIEKSDVLKRVTGKQYIALSNPTIDPSFKDDACVTGTPASGNIVTGIAVLSSAEAVSCKEPCILITEETTPNDFPGMAASVGIITRTGGITSHAAVVARGMDKAAVVGAEELKFEGLAGKQITIDGATGSIWIDKNVPVVSGKVPEFVEEIISWGMGAYDTTFLTVAPESVSKGTEVYVDVSGSLDTVKSLSAALDGCKGSTGILGFGHTNVIPEEDSQFLGFFGVDPRTHEDGTYAVIEKVLSMAKWNATFKKGWTLHLPVYTPDALLKVLRKAGWKLVTTVNSFKAALSADGYIVMEDAFLQQLTREKMNFSEIEELIVKGGGEVKELPSRMTKNRLLFDVLGG